jgi:N-acetylmuramoyl-L-alanine amidase
MRPIKSLIVHCSASEFGNMELIRQWHRQRGFRDIGYHYVILNEFPDNNHWARKDLVEGNDGRIETGRPLEEAGAHAEGHNADSVGVCLVGDKRFSPKQLEALKTIIEYLRRECPRIKILGHYELDPKKTCPNLDMDWVRRYLGEK